MAKDNDKLQADIFSEPMDTEEGDHVDMILDQPQELSEEQVKAAAKDLVNEVAKAWEEAKKE
jgi:hypothetical protein